MPLSGTQEECCLKNAESFGLNLFWYSAIEQKSDHAKISCVPKIYLKKTNLVIMVTSQILRF